jgi:hypothetical protein
MKRTVAVLLVLLAALVCLSSASRQPAAVAADIGRLLEEDVASGFQDISQLQALLWGRHGSNRQVMPAARPTGGCTNPRWCCSCASVSALVHCCSSSLTVWQWQCRSTGTAALLACCRMLQRAASVF